MDPLQQPGAWKTVDSTRPLITASLAATEPPPGAGPRRTLVRGVGAHLAWSISAKTVPGRSTCSAEIRVWKPDRCLSDYRHAATLADVKVVIAEVGHLRRLALLAPGTSWSNRRSARLPRTSGVHLRWPRPAAADRPACAARPACDGSLPLSGISAAMKASGCSCSQTGVAEPGLVIRLTPGRNLPRRSRPRAPTRSGRSPTARRLALIRLRFRRNDAVAQDAQTRAIWNTAAHFAGVPGQHLPADDEQRVARRATIESASRSCSSVSLGSLAGVGVVLGDHRDVVSTDPSLASERASCESPPRRRREHPGRAGSRCARRRRALRVADDRQHQAIFAARCRRFFKDRATALGFRKPRRRQSLARSASVAGVPLARIISVSAVAAMSPSR